MKKHYNLIKGIFFLLSLMAFSYSADAANRTWDGGGDDLTWSDPLNWSSDLVPTAADLAIFTSSETVTITATTTIKILDIRPGITVTLNIGPNTLNVGASGTSNIIRIDASTLLINSGTLNANTADNTRDAVQFRGTGGSFDVGAGATANITGRDAFVSKTDAVNGAINNSGVLNISVLTGDDGILLKSGHPLTLVNNACAVINLGTCRIKTNIGDGANITNNGLITYNPTNIASAGGAILLRTGNTATNNGFYDYANNSTNFATGNAGTGTVVDNGVDLYPTVVIDALGTCMIDLSSTGSGMEAYNWTYGGTTFATNGGDGSLDVTAAGFPNTAGPHTITADCFPLGVTVSIDVTNTCLTGPSSVPTLSEWGLITLSLFLLTFGMIYVGRRKLVLAGELDINTAFDTKSIFQSLPVNWALLKNVILFTMVLSLLAGVLTLSVYGSIAQVDVIGFMITGPLFAYLVHLMILQLQKK